jgi:murein DD-endopeptidase MepM/ murein hydrolase activator NlpD
MSQQRTRTAALQASALLRGVARAKDLNTAAAVSVVALALLACAAAAVAAPSTALAQTAVPPAARTLPVPTAAAAAVAASAAPSDPVEIYQQNLAALDDLLSEREKTETALTAAMASERAALSQLATAETALARLVAEHADARRRQAGFEDAIAAAESKLDFTRAEQARIERRIEAQEAWLFGTDAPRATSMRGYWAALDARGALAAAQEATQERLAGAREAEAGGLAHLGRLNTEIAALEQRADQFSRQVGAARSRALAANSALARIQRSGDALAQQVYAQFDSLVRTGHPAGVARIAQTEPGRVPIPEPAVWPVTPPLRYVLPTGAAAASLRLGEPLTTTQTELFASGALDGIAAWMAPVTGSITTRFGDATPYQPAHWAVDIGTRLYQPVAAAADGVVEFAGLAAIDNRLASYGMVVVVRHSERVTTVYAHLDDRARGLDVQVGDSVAAGQVLGYVGLTGYSTGPHLHLEVRVDNQPVDPLLLVQP